ncbi:MAG: hypothetical protein GH150_00965 [Hadesarchaea archaeon]|nr:hypothetical protein [Hadesarchaea archaeon]
MARIKAGLEQYFSIVMIMLIFMIMVFVSVTILFGLGAGLLAIIAIWVILYLVLVYLPSRRKKHYQKPISKVPETIFGLLL